KGWPTMSRRLILVAAVGCALALLPATRSSWSQTPPPAAGGDDVGEVRTVDVTAVGPVSFDGDVRGLMPVAMDQSQLDLREEGELPELPEGPGFVAPRRPAALAPTAPVPAPAPLTNFRGLGRFDTITGGQAGCGTPPDTNGDVGPHHYIQSVNCAYAIF